MVKCLRQGGWGGGRGSQPGRVGMVRRLLKCLDQVVPILRIYGPQRAFAYALKERKVWEGWEEERGDRERDVIESAIGPLKTHHKHGTAH